MQPIKNTETQKFCEDIAHMYRVDGPQAANEAFKNYLQDARLMRWEIIAMQDQIRFLIHGN